MHSQHNQQYVLDSSRHFFPYVADAAMLLFFFARGTERLVSDKNTLPGHHNPAGSGSDEITVKTPAEHKGPC